MIQGILFEKQKLPYEAWAKIRDGFCRLSSLYVKTNQAHINKLLNLLLNGKFCILWCIVFVDKLPKKWLNEIE